MTDQIEQLITQPGIYPDMPNEVYHADPVPEGSLSSTGARRLLPPSCPALFKWEQDNPVYKREFDIGSAAHMLVLGDLQAKIVVVDANDWRTKAAQSERDQARAEGKTPVLTKDWEQCKAMAQKLWEHPRARLLLQRDGGQPEQSIFWYDEQFGIWRRCRVDWLRTQRRGRLIIVDYKTARSADPKSFARSAIDNGYNQQDPWYCDGVQAIGLDDEPAFVFVVQEKTPPYLVSVIELDSDLTTIGRHLNRQAMQTYAECKRADVWPGYSEAIELVTAPAWYVKQHEDVIAGRDHLPN